MAQIRILMISGLEVWSLSGQGGAPSLFKTLEGLARRGHSIDFVGPKIGANHQFGQPFQPPPPIPGVRYHLFNTPVPASIRLPLPSLLRKLGQKLAFAVLFPIVAARQAQGLTQQQPFDLLYGYEVHGVLAARRLQRQRWPLVVRFQGTIMHPFLDRRLSLLRRYEEVMALRAPAELYIMTNDGTQGDQVLERLNPKSLGKVRFWRNGLNLDELRAASAQEREDARDRLGLARDELVLVTAVRLARWKRVDRALDAVAALQQRGVNARLLVVGDGEERVNLELQARALNIESQVKFVGAVPHEEVRHFLWAADVFLSLNELSNVGNPLLEAMRCGVCILTLDVGDTRDLILNDETGVLMPTGEPRAIAESLVELAADAERRARLGEAALEFANLNFWSWQRRIDAEAEALEEIMAAQHAAGAVDV